MNGELQSFLEAARADGQSYQTIATRLLVEQDITTTDTTVSKWCRELGID